jgi:hypothetical protein
MLGPDSGREMGRPIRTEAEATHKNVVAKRIREALQKAVLKHSKQSEIISTFVRRRVEWLARGHVNEMTALELTNHRRVANKT